MPSAKQQPSNVKHAGAIRPNVWVLTFGPPCIIMIQIHIAGWSVPRTGNDAETSITEITLSIAPGNNHGKSGFVT